MKKRNVILIAILLVLMMPAFAQSPNDFSIDLTRDHSGIIITGYRGNETRVVIPAEIEGIPVRTIGREAFRRRLNIREVIIPDTVITIDQSAFDGCTSLTYVVIPNSVTTIGRIAFAGCRSLTSAVVPNSVATIGSAAFGDCTSLTSVVLPNSITEIASNTFKGCTSLAAIVIPNSVTTIWSDAFRGCSELTTVELSEGANIRIENGAFRDCRKLGMRSQLALGRAGYQGSF